MIYDDIKHFNKQFEYEPKVENATKLKKFKKFLVVGMGGSHLAADILKSWKPDIDIVVWNDYGLPPLKDVKERLLIANSYSGKTEETIDSLNAAKAHHVSSAVISTGGKLIGLAQKHKLPYVQMPDLHMQPRMALGLNLRGLLALMGDKSWLNETLELAKELHPARHEIGGKALAKRLYGSVPIIYASLKNQSVAYNWKIKFNETGKTPAFMNVFPELNHNEMTSFDVKLRTATLSKNFHFIFLKDIDDDKRIIRRMNILEKLLFDRGFKVEALFMQGKNRLQKIFNSLNLADWTAYHTALQYGVEPEQVPMVEEFKKLMVPRG
ncbi:MAG: hypothetical protein KGJ89_02285 [Patescibacteria group bacterium]|nr:hypothetical protein [Patescibacteria group bacterium]MDE2015705.1 hypothetical protein [Patescibacteria group bacterium]MDE2226763.1 hypothetical protein [Patescibacteria group bacterium]